MDSSKIIKLSIIVFAYFACTKPTTLEKIKKTQIQAISSPSTKVKSKVQPQKELPAKKPEKKEVKK